MSYVLVTMSFGVVVPVEDFLDVLKQFSCVMVNLMFLYPAEMMNHFVPCCFDLTHCAMAGNFYV